MFSEIGMDVEDSAVVATIKREILPKLTKPDTYSTYYGNKQVNIICRPPEPETASLAKSISPSITERLIQKFGRSEPPQPPGCFEMPRAYLSWPSTTYGEEAQSQQVAHAFLSLMREAKLDDALSLQNQGVKEDSRIFLSIDIDSAVRCPECEKPLDLGHVYHAFGTDLAGIYTILDVFCSKCGLRRSIDSLPPAVVAVHDRLRRKFLANCDEGTHLSIHASDWLQKEQLRRLDHTGACAHNSWDFLISKF
jgi:hypothetical protein